MVKRVVPDLTWEANRIEFENLAREDAILGADCLSAACDYSKPPRIRDSAGKPQKNSPEIIRAPRGGLWLLDGGSGQGFRERFRTAAARAGRGLHENRGDAEGAWLDRLYSYVQKNAADFLAPPLGGRTSSLRSINRVLRVCEASVALCAWLERHAVADSSRDASRSAKRNRERGLDYDKSYQRVELEDSLRAELGTIKSRADNYTTVDSLKKEFPAFNLWKILSSSEQNDLLSEEFKPRAYARTLVMRKFGLTNRETIKKDRQKLSKAKKQHRFKSPT